jgi:nucleoside-diphosphate-sugar epimerase
MVNRVLVSGGTGTLGRVVTRRLLDAGAQVRVLSRGLRPTSAIGQAQHVIGDVKTGSGLAEAIADVDTVVHCVDPAIMLSARPFKPGVRIWSTSRSSESTGYHSATTSASSPTNS